MIKAEFILVFILGWIIYTNISQRKISLCRVYNRCSALIQQMFFWSFRINVKHTSVFKLKKQIGENLSFINFTRSAVHKFRGNKHTFHIFL